jgi:hypothetical protein
MLPCKQQYLELDLKGKASAAYELAMSDLESISDATWHTLLQHFLVEYVTLLTNPYCLVQSAPSMTRKEVIKCYTARKEASTAAIAGSSH